MESKHQVAFIGWLNFDFVLTNPWMVFELRRGCMYRCYFTGATSTTAKLITLARIGVPWVYYEFGQPVFYYFFICLLEFLRRVLVFFGVDIYCVAIFIPYAYVSQDNLWLSGQNGSRINLYTGVSDPESAVIWWSFIKSHRLEASTSGYIRRTSIPCCHLVVTPSSFVAANMLCTFAKEFCWLRLLIQAWLKLIHLHQYVIFFSLRKQNIKRNQIKRVSAHERNEIFIKKKLNKGIYV